MVTLQETLAYDLAHEGDYSHVVIPYGVAGGKWRNPSTPADRHSELNWQLKNWSAELMRRMVEDIRTNINLLPADYPPEHRLIAESAIRHIEQYYQ